MLYVKNITVPKNTSKDSPYTVEITIHHYMIRKISVYFPRGIHGNVGVSFWYGEDQFFPFKEYDWVSGDNETVEGSVYFSPGYYPFNITIKAYNLDDDYDHSISIRIEAVDEEVAKWEQAIYRLVKMFEDFIRFLTGR